MTMVESDTKTRKTAVAKHLLLDAAGQVVEEFEQASGARYVNIESGQTFDYLPKATVGGQPVTLDPGCPALMLAVFGTRTLATNEASAARQKDGSAADEMDAITTRFYGTDDSTGIENGVWVDRTREGGPRIDTAVLAQATFDIFVEDKIATRDQEAAALPKILAKFDDPKEGKAQISKVRSNPKIDARYKVLKGGKSATVQDLGASLMA